MCGIGGVTSLSGRMGPEAEQALRLVNQILAHRGPDGHATWVNQDHVVGLSHRRLSIIDVGENNTGAQPMRQRIEAVAPPRHQAAD